MRNEDIAEAMRALELSFKQHADGQLAKFTALLEQYMLNTETRLAKLTAESVKGEENSNGGPTGGLINDPSNLHPILKTLRINVPRFDGNDVEEWIFKIDKFFSLHRLPPDTRLAVVAFHLDGEASTWYQWMEKSGVLTCWDVFLQELRKRFGASIYDDPLGRISKLVQSGTVAKFRAEFEELMTRITGVGEPMFLSFFVWGLKMEIRRELLISPPLNLAEAMAKAQLYEDRNEDLVSRPKREGYKSLEGGATRGSTTLGLTSGKQHMVGNSHVVAPTRGTGSPLGSTKIPIKHLSPTEIQEKREKGLCFSCDEKWNSSHRCKNRVLIMCGEEGSEDKQDNGGSEEEDAATEEELEVSFNTFSNSLNPQIFRIMAYHGLEKLEVLIDTGSNNNFIQEALVARLGLKWETAKLFKVYIGNGQYLVCDKNA